jgi:SHS2 domain-containing protein
MLEAPHREHFSHDADIGVRGYGRTLAEAYEQSALALTAIVTDPRRVVPRESVAFSCEAPDREFLLVDWLNRVIYEMSTRKMLFSRFEVALGTQGNLHATLWGEPVSVERHEPAVEPKGATYTALSVTQQGEQWVAQCVIDV